jgi:flagellar hook-associated protein 2
MSSLSPNVGANPSVGIPQFNIGGIASGLDTNSIITSLMSIEKLPQNRIVQQQTLETARRDDLTAIQSQLSALSGTIATLVSPGTWTTTQAITSSDPAHVTAVGAGVPTGGFEISVSHLARAAQMTQPPTSTITAAATGDQLTIQVGANAANAFTVAVSAGDSLDTIAHAINVAGPTQVFASVVNSKLVISSQVTGAANTISVTSTGGGTLATDLGLTQTVAPQDAHYTLDGGADQASASNVLTNIASGMTVTLLGVTSSPASITVSPPGPNTTAVQAAIQSFVTTYNATVDMVSAKVNESRVVNPTTDADRAKGDLEGDPSLMSLLSRLRTSIGDLVSGQPSSMNTFAQAGLSTGAATGTGTLNDASIQGDLTLDVTKLTSALTTQFSDVKSLFSNVTGSYGSEGLAQRMNDVLSTFVGSGGVLGSEITSSNSTIASLGKQKTDWDVRLADKEAALRRTYTAMETAMQQSQSQGTWLAGQVAKLP